MVPLVSPGRVARLVEGFDTSPAYGGLAEALRLAIGDARIPVGTRLPTVRDLSKELGVSPTTVSEAWQSLAAVGAIDARGRQGTFVRQPTGPATPRRYRRVTEGPGRFALDLSTGTPDPALLPDLRPVIARVSRQSLTSSYLDQPVLPELAARVRADWPFHAEELTVVDGGYGKAIPSFAHLRARQAEDLYGDAKFKGTQAIVGEGNNPVA